MQKCGLFKDREALTAFYDFPAEYRVHIRTTNRSSRPSPRCGCILQKRGRVSRANMLAMVFMPAKSAERGWRRLKGAQRLAELIAGVQFKNGVLENSMEIAA